MDRIPLSKTTKFIVDNRGRTAPTASTGIPLIATNCISNKDLYPIYENLRYVSAETYESWFRSHPEPGDIILTLKGSQNGAVCLVPNPVDFAIAQDMVALRVDEDAIYPLFLFAALRSDDVQHQIKNLDVSGVIPHLKKSDFDKLLIPFPGSSSQKEIGDIYFLLSSKIDLLHCQNKTLESLAQTLFRQWFIEEADDSWETVTISDVAILNQSSVDKDYGYTAIEYLDTGSITDNVISEYQYLDLVDAPSRARRIVKNDDIVISQVRPIQRHYGLLKSIKPNTVVSTGFCVVTCWKIDPHFMYIFLTQKDMTEYLDVIADASTSAYPSLKPSDIACLEFKMPPKALHERFSAYASVAWQKLEANRTQIHSLKNLRDSLLPKLMSGDITTMAGGQD